MNIEFPDPMVKGHQCKNCKHWLQSRAADYANAMGPQGNAWIPLTEVRRQHAQAGKIMDPSKMIVTRCSFCTVFPMWVVHPDQHWCGQFAQRIDA